LAHHMHKSPRNQRRIRDTFSLNSTHSEISKDETEPLLYVLMEDAPEALARVFAFAYADMAGVSLARNLSRRFYAAIRPGCPYYSEVVRCKEGVLSKVEKRALWDQLVLGAVTVDEKSKRLIYGKKDFDTLIKEGKENSYANDVEKDVRRLMGYRSDENGFGRVDISAKSYPQFHARMCNILYATSAVFTEVGYCQGMSFPAFHLAHSLGLLPYPASHEDPPTAGGFHPDPERLDAIGFHAFYAFLGPLGLGKIFAPQLTTMNHCIHILQDLIRQNLPVLHQHFEAEGFEISLFAIGWLESLFVYIEAMPVQTINRIWDIWIADASFKILFQVSIAILQLSMQKLLDMDFEGIIQYLQKLPNEDILHSERLIPCALGIKITQTQLSKL